MSDAPQTLTANAAAVAEKPWLKAQGSKYFLDWLAEQQISLNPVRHGYRSWRL